MKRPLEVIQVFRGTAFHYTAEKPLLQLCRGSAGFRPKKVVAGRCS
jgi:hypothetical protein